MKLKQYKKKKDENLTNFSFLRLTLKSLPIFQKEKRGRIPKNNYKNNLSNSEKSQYLKVLQTFCFFIILLTFSLVTSCASTKNKQLNNIPTIESKEKKKIENEDNQKINKNIRKIKIENKLDIKDIKPIFKDLSPLDTQKIYISVKEQNYKELIYYIAREANLNIIFQPNIEKYIPAEYKFLTLELKNVTLRKALKIITNMLGIDFKIENGILKIIAIDEKLFHLDFLPYLRNSKFDIGGDVLGSQYQNSQNNNEQDIITPLKGNIEVSGNINKKTLDIYSIIEDNIKKLISPEGKFVLNKYSGILYVKDRVKNIKKIEKYIKTIKEKYIKQVLIEAKILEVDLNQEHELGINWQAIFRNDLKDTAYLSGTAGFLWENSNTFILNFKIDPYFDSIIKAIQKQGNLKIISNPRIRVMHGQPAIIGVGKSISYIREVDRETTAYEGVTTVETTVETSAVFDGLLFEVTPFINSDNTITLHIIPIKSDVVELKNVKFEDYEITLPLINLRETSTIIKTKENDLIIISGLIMEKNGNIEYSVPKFKKIPIIGNIFKSKKRKKEKVELIILLKIKII